MTVGQRIFELLKQKGMTQKEFSERTGIATTTISDWRKKNTNPGSDKILLICAALEVTPEYLLSGVSEDSDRGRNKEYVVTLYPSVNISGNCTIGECVELGTGMQIIQGKSIVGDSIVGAGAVVVRNIVEAGTYVGVPARREII